MQERGEFYELAENRAGISGNDRRNAAGNFSLQAADCGNAFHRQFQDHGKPAATHRRAAESDIGRREIGLANGRARGAVYDRFRPDVLLAADSV